MADQQYRKNQKQKFASIRFSSKRWRKLKRKKDILLSLLPQAFSSEGLAAIARKIGNQIKLLIDQIELLIYKLNPKAEKPLPYILRTKIITQKLREAVKNYIPEKYDGRIDLFRVNSSIYQSEEGYDNDELGWEEFAAGGLTIHPVPGNHGTLLDIQHVEILASKLKVLLQQRKGEL
jgi:hypothetical protein